MFSTLLVVLPIFALVFCGYLCRRRGVLGPHATSELNRFVVFLALPALLFDIMAHANWAALDQPGFVLAFGLACAATFAGTLAARLKGGRPLADATLDGLNAAYANTGFIGFPLCLVLFGPASLALVTVATILTACVLFAVAIILIQAGLQTGQKRAALVWSVGTSLLRNPLLMAPATGAVIAAAGVPIHASAESFLKLLGAAASPAALVALGSFLAEKRQGQSSFGTAGLLVALKLLIQPALAWGLALALGLPPGLVKVVVLLSALPTGTGPFMLAELYGREAAVTSSTILVSTVLSLGTVTLLLAALG
jgi:predicted permease